MKKALYLIILVLLLFLGWSDAVTAQDICRSEVSKIRDLVVRFEKLQKKRDPLGVLRIFTPTANEEERADLFFPRVRQTIFEKPDSKNN